VSEQSVARGVSEQIRCSRFERAAQCSRASAKGNE
jgi:hypothetical protein